MINDLIESHLEEVSEIVSFVQTREFNFGYVIPELREISVNLLPAPEEAINEFNILYALVQSYQSRIVSIIVELREEKQSWLSTKRTVDNLFRKLRNKILAEPEISSLKNQDLREAAVSKHLEMVVSLQTSVDNVLKDLEYLVEMCALKREDLERTNVNMSRQQKVVESLINLGYPVSYLNRKR